jgi:hypothetical protein
MSASGPKRTLAFALQMSAFGSKADIAKLLTNHAERGERGNYKLAWGPKHWTGWPAAQSTSNRSPSSFSKIREYFNSLAEILSLLLLGKFEFVTQRQLPNSKSAALAGFWAATA